METTFLKAFQVVGVSVRTTNENGQAAKDIPALWQRFFAENISEKVKDKLSETVYAIYTDYEKDHTKPYTTIVGYAVEELKIIPDGLVSILIEEGSYSKFTAKGKLDEGAVYNEWLNIWNAPIERIFTTDFEVYDEKSTNPQNAEVDIFIAIK